jgi:hypothetical protein
VAEHKNASFFFLAPLRPNHIADFFSGDHLRGQSLGTQVFRNHETHVIDQILAVTWTLKFHQGTQQLKDLIRFGLDFLD